MSISVRDQITTELQKAKSANQLNPNSVRQIVRTAIADSIKAQKQETDEMQVTVAIASGMEELDESQDVTHELVKQAIAAVVDQLNPTDVEMKEDVAAAVEGAIEGMSSHKREAILKAQQEMQTLQSQINEEEKNLHNKIDYTLKNLESNAKFTSDRVKVATENAIRSFKDIEEFSLMQKRYAQLQAQLSILKANLSARYGEQYEDVKKYLDDAKNWYEEAQQRAKEQGVEEGNTAVQRKQAEFEHKIGEAGSAIARRERRVRQILKELWEMVAGGHDAA